MKKVYLTTLLFLTTLLVGISNLSAQPFDCDYNAYLFQYNDIYAIDLASGNAYLVAEDIVEGSVNAAAYNPSDGYIWGSVSQPQKSIVRIGKNFDTEIYQIDGLPTGNSYIGDISSNGIYYLKPSGTTYYAIDINPSTANYNSIIGNNTLSTNINIHDWAFNSVDSLLYSVEKNSNKLYRINPVNGVVENLGVVPILDGLNYTYGAVYFDNTGAFYVSANQTGSIYIIEAVQDIQNGIISSNIFAFGPSSASNDGARCPTAPVAKEICDNGIDDDGDGLVDCDDPSCSGVGNCAERNTSGSNDGGLESNNRLSTAISKRNFNRQKNNYSKEKTDENKVLKSSNYGNKTNTRIDDINLHDLIPLDIISDATAFEATPEDLIAITNASEIYSVDYYRADQRVAAILALKTENGVYEHSKFICDRLLGAELLSVSTIEINNVPFIKSIIKSPNGEIEFALSLSARVLDNEFEIESHWNIDQYTSGFSYYNFQVWSNSIDNLYQLGQEILNLLTAQKEINNYKVSPPPAVYVKSAKYKSGILTLDIVNTNNTEEIIIEGGYRITETGNEQSFYETIQLTDYLEQKTIPIENLFDFGCRISSPNNITADDIFLSDGPWGLDDSDITTTINSYEVVAQSVMYDGSNYPMERGVHLEAEINNYVAAYKAFTPRFEPVDLSNFNNFSLIASGSGTLEITIIKDDITDWEKQFRTEIYLTNEMQTFDINTTSFISEDGSPLDLSNVKMLVFTMRSTSDNKETVAFQIENLVWNHRDITLSSIDNKNETASFYPSLIKTTSQIVLSNNIQEEITVQISNLKGELVWTKTVNRSNTNTINFNRSTLPNGIYFYTIQTNQQFISSGKLVFIQ